MRQEPQCFALHSRRTVTPEGVLDCIVVVENGKIRALLPPDAPPADLPVKDLGDWVLMPGLVDTHVHINEPGRTEWEGFETATRAAAAGGITTLVDMPLNCTPVTTTLAALQIKLAEARDRLWVDCGFWGGVIPGNTAELPGMIRAGALGFKAFLIHSGIDDFPNVTEADLREAMPVLAQWGVPLLVHAELDCTGKAPAEGDPQSYPHYLASRPASWEVDAIALMIRLSRETGCRVHIVHLSAADALPMLAQARTEGVPITVETCPHYLTLQSEAIPRGDTSFKCAPPIRGRENQGRLWEGLKEGVIDTIVSDHSPCMPALKLPERGDFMEAWGGIASLQFGLPAIWMACQQRGLGLTDLLRWMSTAPARLIGLENRKGQLVPGMDADLVAWDPEADVQILPQNIYHRHKVTPYAYRTLRGKVHGTWLRGQQIFIEGSFPAGTVGKPVLRLPSPLQETLG